MLIYHPPSSLLLVLLFPSRFFFAFSSRLLPFVSHFIHFLRKPFPKTHFLPALLTFLARLLLTFNHAPHTFAIAPPTHSHFSFCDAIEQFCFPHFRPLFDAYFPGFFCFTHSLSLNTNCASPCFSTKRKLQTFAT